MAFLFIGRLIKDKGIIEYLEACRIVKHKYPQVRCILVGPFDSNPTALKPEELKPYIDERIIDYDKNIFHKKDILIIKYSGGGKYALWIFQRNI